MMMIDTEKFLVEIQARECIWNPKVKEYSIKSERRKAWEEVAGVFSPDWEISSPEDQDKLVEELIKKWKYQKDYYFRCYKDKSGIGKKKKPNYFDALTFLDATREPKETSNAAENSDSVEETQNVIDTEVTDEAQTALPTSTRSVTMKKTQFQIKLMKSLQNTEQNDGACNSNKNFLLSLLPEMEKMNEDQNLEFRVFVLNIMKDIKTNVLPIQRNYDYVTELLQVSDANEESASRVSHEEHKDEQFCEDSKDSSENIRNFSNHETSYPPSNKKQKAHDDQNTTQEFPLKPESDDCAIFAEYIAKEMRKIKDDTILAMAKHKITNVIFESQMKYYEIIKNKPSEPVPSASNTSSTMEIRTSIELVPVKIEVD